METKTALTSENLPSMVELLCTSLIEAQPSIITVIFNSPNNAPFFIHTYVLGNGTSYIADLSRVR